MPLMLVTVDYPRIYKAAKRVTTYQYFFTLQSVNRKARQTVKLLLVLLLHGSQKIYLDHS